MLELQDLGESLCALAEDSVRSLDISDALRDAALASKTITKHEARRRHMQYVGKLVREHSDDVETLRLAIDQVDQRKKQDNSRFHALENWRDRLLAGDDALVEEIVAAHPAADRQRLRQLARNATAELNKSKPPKSKRALFKYLREIVES